MDSHKNPFTENLEILKNYKLPLILCFVGLVLIVGGLWTSNHKNTITLPKQSLVNASQVGQTELKVNVSGAVNRPGVYSLLSNNRVEDAIKVAGGFSPKVNQEYISKVLNLSQKLSDGQKIYIPFANEKVSLTPVSTSTVLGANTNSLVGINSGSPQDLDNLPGVGLVTANKIIAGRPYTVISELLSRKIVSKSVYDKIKPLVDTN